MPPRRLGIGVAALTALLWAIGALEPWHPRLSTALDLRWYFFPLYEAFYGALRAGAPMLWNPYQLCGLPWLGTLQAGFFYPPHLLYVLSSTPTALALSTAAHLALAAGGAAAFARRVGASPAAAVLAAAVFVFAGPLRSVQLWPYFLEASSWLPLGALAVLELTGERPGRGALALAIVSGMSWLAGCPQASVLSWYAWAALLLARLVVARPSGAVAARALGGFAVGLVGGVLLGGVTLLPSLDLARESIRPTATLGVDFMYPFGTFPPETIWRRWLQSGSPVLLLTALGLAPLAVAAGARALVAWGFIVAGLAAAFAAGPATPLFRLYLALPLLGWFRMPPRTLIVGQLALGVLAALALDVVAARARRPQVATLAVVIVLAAVLFHGMRAPRIVPPLPYREAAAAYSPAQRAAYARLAATIGERRVWPFGPGLQRYSLPPKLPTLARLRSFDDYEPLLPRRYFEYFGFLGEGAVPAPGRREYRIDSLAASPGRDAIAARRRLLDLAAVQLMIVPTQIRQRPDVAAFVREARLASRPPLAEGLELIENPHVLPRAFVTYRTRPAPPVAALLPLLARDSFDPLAESWVEDDAGLPASAAAPPRGAPARILRDEPHVVEIEAALAAPGLVVLADTYHPGWVARVDGVRAPILATNHLFRGVRAPAGMHRIRFEYRPRSLAIGAALTLTTVLGLGLVALRWKGAT
jgi:hypothetical protein